MNPLEKQQSESSQEPVIIHEKITKKSGETIIRKYARGKILGRGGFATCYEITDIEKGQTLAAKVVAKSSLTKKRALEKLLAEIKIHKSLQHENIVKFEHVFEDKENVYILLEVCPNQTLKELLKRRKRITELECAFYLSQTISALKYLHEKKIIHRDLKLGNLFLGKSFDIKVGDLGLAAKIENDGEKRRTICGTPNYIAPEVLDKRLGHSYEVDVWALGVICYTLLIGRPPYETSDTKTTYRKIVKNNYSFPSSVTISEDAKDFIKKILVLEPTQRPTLDDLLQHPFIKNHSNKSMSTQNQTLKKPLTLQSGQSPAATSLPSDRGFHQPVSHGHMRDSGDTEKHINGENEAKDNMSSSEKKLDKKRTNLLLKPVTMDGINHQSLNNDNKAPNEQISDLKEPEPKIELDVHVTKWIDYSTKFGLGYVLSNNTSGVVFNDGTRLTMAPNEKAFDYMKKDVQNNREVLSAYNMTNYPKELEKKVLLLKHFREYLLGGLDNINHETDHTKELKTPGEEAEVKSSPLLHVKSWMKSNHANVFKLSNRIVQADFEDKTKIILDAKHEIVHYLNKKSENSQHNLMTALDLDYPEMVKRLKYTKDILTYMRKTKNPQTVKEEKEQPQQEPCNIKDHGLESEDHTVLDGVTGKLPQMNIYRGMNGVKETDKGRL